MLHLSEAIRWSVLDQNLARAVFRLIPPQRAI